MGGQWCAVVLTRGVVFGVMAAPLAARILDKSLVSDRVLIDTIVSKYADHSPLYRQSAILRRDAGVEISRATMCGWVMQVGEMLQPVVSAMRRELLSGSYIQADETPVEVQTHDQRGIGGPKMVHAASWSHARRHFVDAVKLNKQDVASIRAVELMDALFAIDREARDQNMDHAARHLLRQQKAPPLLDQIREHILAMSKTVLPRSAAGQACSYTLALWKKLTRFLDYPQLELSNNLAENSMRPVATGRKNWIHIGSEQAGPRVAAILSLVESCRRFNIPVHDYLGDILPGLAHKSIQRIATLTPAAWTARKL